MAYTSQVQFEVLCRALWAQQAKPNIDFDWKFWERAAQDPKMTCYLHQGVKVKMLETIRHRLPGEGRNREGKNMKEDAKSGRGNPDSELLQSLGKPLLHREVALKAHMNMLLFADGVDPHIRPEPQQKVLKIPEEFPRTQKNG